jgi:hypothetical protein
MHFCHHALVEEKGAKSQYKADVQHAQQQQEKEKSQLEEIKSSPGTDNLSMGSAMAFSGLMPSR